jgi:1-deoxy-D-xylulose-5-phosphate synthase
MKEIQVGTGRKLRDGEDIAILSFGHPGNFAAAAIREVASEGINPAHYDMRFVKPIDEDLLHQVFKKFKYVVTIEDGCLQGGMGTAVLEFMADHNYSATVVRLGIPDQVIEHGEQPELWAECGYDFNGIIKTRKQYFIVLDMNFVNLFLENKLLIFKFIGK